LAVLARAAMALPTLLRVVRGRRPDLERFEAYLRGVAVAAGAFDAEARPEPVGIRALLLSDLHDNAFGMAIAARLANGPGQPDRPPASPAACPADLVLVAGDVTDAGTREEAGLFLRLFGLDDIPVVMVGGNHESEAALRAFEAGGIKVLDWEASTVAGLTVYGVGDPLARSAWVEPDEALLDRQAERLAALWPDLPTPDVLLVHDLRQARAALDLTEKSGEPLVVACGHDHSVGVERRGPVTVVNGGTTGAGGHESLGRGESLAYTALLLDFTPGPRSRLRQVTTLEYVPGGRSRATFEPIEADGA
jgi:predicted phosphodiesterase